MTMKPCDFCEGHTPDDRGKECSHCAGYGVMYEVMHITTPEGETYFMGGWDTAEAVQGFGDCLEVKHLKAYPKE